MARFMGIYKCEICGNMVEVVHEGRGEMICCDQPMTLQEENTVDASREKHVPVIEPSAEGIMLKVGSIAHPMEEQHYIEWIEIIVGGKTCRVFLKPGDAPQSKFLLAITPGLIARAYCNIHGLWKA